MPKEVIVLGDDQAMTAFGISGDFEGAPILAIAPRDKGQTFESEEAKEAFMQEHATFITFATRAAAETLIEQIRGAILEAEAKRDEREQMGAAAEAILARRAG